MRIDDELSSKFDCDPLEFIRIEFDQCNDYSARRAAVRLTRTDMFRVTFFSSPPPLINPANSVYRLFDRDCWRSTCSARAPSCSTRFSRVPSPSCAATIQYIHSRFVFVSFVRSGMLISDSL